LIAAFLKVSVVALALALDVFAVSVGVGVRGVPRAVKVRIGIAFACAEIVMNLVGAALGLAVGKAVGGVAGYIGFSALTMLGAYMIWESREESSEASKLDLSQGWGLFVASLSISLDSLGIGFSILYIGVPLPISLGVIGVVSVLSTTLGLSLGRRIGAAAEANAGLIGGVVLVLTGFAFTILKALNLG